jgi:hypothetical protein
MIRTVAGFQVLAPSGPRVRPAISPEDKPGGYGPLERATALIVCWLS